MHFLIPYTGTKPQRDQGEIQAVLAQKKAEIERRCLELDPPIHPDALPFMASYHNAMKIIRPMDDASWDFLRPLLLNQREAAEELAHQKQADLAALQSTIPSDYQEDTRPAREVFTEEYQCAQEPLRKKLGDYADEFVANQWGSQTIHKDNSARFATGLLQYVYWRYEDAKSKGELATTLDPPGNGSGKATQWKPFLSLDNMKWVYDNKVRHRTDPHRRDLFVCVDCVDDPKAKPFAFEGLIQHYGAKHTTDFSRNNIVVHWQTAAWPDEPPFATDPSLYTSSHQDKAGRKGAPRKSNGHAQNNVEHGRGEAQRTPSATKLLSENPYFSPGAYPPPQHAYDPLNSGASQYPGYGYNDAQYPAASWGQPFPSAVPAAPEIDTSDNAQSDKLASDAREIWDALEGVRDMIVATKVHTAIHHAAKRFRAHFGFAPSLDTLTAVLAYNAKIRPIKNATSLYCKSCVAQAPGGIGQKSYYERTLSAKTWNISSLSTHWNIVHKHESNHPDWTKDMLDIPENKLVRQLLRAPGMDDTKLALVADAFPLAFAFPLPTIGVIPEVAANGSAPSLANRLLGRMNKQPPQGKKRKKSQVEHNGKRQRDGSDSDPLPEAKDDEYDPRRPAFVKTEDSPDPSRFDTDIARTASASAAQNGDSHHFGLAPETMVALNSLQQHAAEVQRERSPSVGAPERPQSTIKAEAPDISAILATITGQSQQQPARSSALLSSSSGRPGSGSRQQYSDPYQPVHAAPAHCYPPPQEQNMQAYASNRHYQPQQQSMDYAYDYPPQHAYSRPSSSSAVAPPAASPPASLYMSRPLPPAPRNDYRQAHAERQAIYVDEHGRQIYVVPYPGDPAPVQYAPHPYDRYEQQQQPQPPLQHQRRGPYE